MKTSHAEDILKSQRTPLPVEVKPARNMKALVLAGGRGTRLRPFTYSLAKQLLPVANRPVIHYVMDHLHEAEISEVGVIISPETGDQIRASLEPNPWNFDFEFLQQDEPLGLAHTVKVAGRFLGNQSFVMYLGDNLIGGGISGLVHRFRNSQVDALLMLKEVEDPRQFGVAVVDANTEIARLVEKPREHVSNLALVGVYCFSSRIHEAVANTKPSWRGELEITDAIQNLLEDGGRVEGFNLTDWWLDCGKKDDLLSANSLVLRDFCRTLRDGHIDDDSEIEGEVSVAKDAWVINSRLIGPVTIGPNSTIENSELGPSVSVGSDSTIADSSMCDSVILSGSTIRGIRFMAKSIVGHGSTLTKSGSGSVQVTVGDGSELEF